MKKETIIILSIISIVFFILFNLMNLNKEAEEITKKTSDRFGCSDFKHYIEKNFHNKPKVDCEKIQIRFNK